MVGIGAYFEEGKDYGQRVDPVHVFAAEASSIVWERRALAAGDWGSPRRKVW